MPEESTNQLPAEELPDAGAPALPCSAYWSAVQRTSEKIIGVIPKCGSSQLVTESAALRKELSRLVGIFERAKHPMQEPSGEVWIVFKHGTPPEFQGVFREKARAIAACRTPDHCVCPAIMDEEIAQGTEEWKGAWYPGLQDDPQNAGGHPTGATENSLWKTKEQP